MRRLWILAGIIVVMAILWILSMEYANGAPVMVTQQDFIKANWKICLEGTEKTKSSKRCTYVYDTKYTPDPDMIWNLLEEKVGCKRINGKDLMCGK